MVQLQQIQRRIWGLSLMELVVVIAILGILGIVVVLAIDPVETQRRAEDANRRTDLIALKTAVDQALAAGAALPGSVAKPFVGKSTENRDSADKTNYLGMDLSKYLPRLPADPRQNSADTTSISDGKTQIQPGAMVYTFISNGRTYELNTYFESTDNAALAANDGGSNAIIFEVGTQPGLDLLP